MPFQNIRMSVGQWISAINSIVVYSLNVSNPSITASITNISLKMCIYLIHDILQTRSYACSHTVAMHVLSLHWREMIYHSQETYPPLILQSTVLGYAFLPRWATASRSILPSNAFTSDRVNSLHYRTPILTSVLAVELQVSIISTSSFTILDHASDNFHDSKSHTRITLISVA